MNSHPNPRATDAQSTAPTAGPWRFMSGGESAPGYIVGREPCTFVAQLLGHDGIRDKAREDADGKLIIRAVNSHADLLDSSQFTAGLTEDLPQLPAIVAALQESEPEFAHYLYALRGLILTASAKARAAIAKAEGRT